VGGLGGLCSKNRELSLWCRDTTAPVWISCTNSAAVSNNLNLLEKLLAEVGSPAKIKVYILWTKVVFPLILIPQI